MNLSYSKEVEEALKQNRPILALESTIIAHGMPYPNNYETAIDLEELVRANGAVPATIAIIGGLVKIGLSKAEVLELSKGKNVEKVSIRDIPYVVAMKKNGATTVAATIFLAHKANIKFFSTGGIGGVHRDLGVAFDISTDLWALSKYDVHVISAGPKSVLDLSNTMEYLETAGVSVLGFKTDYLPAFFTRESDVLLHKRVESVKEIIKIVIAKEDLELEGGIVIANPISKDDQLERSVIDKAILNSLEEAKREGISGKKITPYLLSKINKLTNGESLKANISLVKNNVILGAKLAVEYNRQEN